MRGENERIDTIVNERILLFIIIIFCRAVHHGDNITIYHGRAKTINVIVENILYT